MSRIAFVFPGQGSQSVGMGKDLADRCPAARAVYQLADDVLGYAISRLCWEGPADELTRTSVTQPAIVTTSLACAAALKDVGILPHMVAGHSVGEVAALAAAGVLTPEDALRLAHRRGQLMEGARAGTMAAVLNMAHSALEAVCERVSDMGLGTVVVANFNTADQIVISGDVAAVDKAAELALAGGARKVMRLNVGGAFHSPLMADAMAELTEVLDAMPFHDAHATFLSSTTVSAVTSGPQLRDIMKRQIVSQVRWEPTMQLLLADRPGCVVEVGNGSTLSGLLKKIDRSLETLRTGDGAALEACAAHVLNGVRAAG